MSWLALLACSGDPADEDRSGTEALIPTIAPVAWEDRDGDGYGDPATETMDVPWGPGWSLAGGDCDDGDAHTHPGATELCDNGRDNDCDPDTPAERSPIAPIWFVDADHDLHGDATRAVQSCQPDGNAPTGDDCDDGDPTSFPGALEICDGGDNDCDPETDEEQTALWYLDADGDGYGIDLDPEIGCTPPDGWVQRSGDCDDDDASLNPTLAPGCVQTHCGTISVSETWKSTVKHHVTCEVVVEGPSWPLLTLLDGVDVVFDPSTGLRVGSADGGSLVVRGDLHGVGFASSEPFPAPGDWDGLTFGLEDRGSRITGLRVVNGGANGKGGVVVEGGSPRFDRLTSRANTGHGLYVAASDPLVHDSRLVDNALNGLFVAEGAGLAREAGPDDPGPSFADNVVTGNGGLPITVPGSYADEIAPDNTLAPNGTGEIELLSGTLATSGVWYAHGLPYRVVERGAIRVGTDPHASLAIEDGVRVFFGIGAELAIGEGGGGRLELDDGPDGILFSGTVGVVMSRSHWDGVRFGVDDTGSIVRNLTIEHGGANGKGNLAVNGSGPLFDRVTSRYSDTTGLYVAGSDAAPTIHDCAFVENEEHGVFVESGSGIARSPFGPSFRNNLLTGNGGSPIVVPPNFLGELDPSSEFTGNEGRIGVHGGRVVDDATWRALDEDYQIRGPIEIGGPDGPVVTLEDDVGLWFDRDTVLTVGVTDDGALLVDGEQGVVMTSSLPIPAEGDWQGLEIGRNSEDQPQTSLSGLTVSHAGGTDAGGGGAIEILDPDDCRSLGPVVTLDGVTILSSSKAGVFAEAQTRFVAEGLEVSDTFGGCWDVSGGECPDPEVVSFADNRCESATFGIWPLSQVEQLDETSTYPGPIVLEGTTVTDDLVLPALGVPFRIGGMVKVEHATAPVLTVSRGAVLEFAADAGLEVGVAEPGGLVVEPDVLLTSPTSVPWQGIKAGRHCTTVSLTGVTLAWPGANTVGGLWVDRCEHSRIEAVNVTDAPGCGVYVDPRVRSIHLAQFEGGICR